MEYLDLYNNKLEKVGKIIQRGTTIPSNYYIMISIIFMENSDGKFLFQMTSKEKGSIWATTGGHVSSGDDSFSTIQKEVYEELGYKIDSNKIKHIYTGMKSSIILEVYYIKEDIDIYSLVLQKEEVESVKWLSRSEIKELIKQDLVRKSNVEIMYECGLL